LFAHHEKLALEWVKKYEGQELPVLIEKVDGERKNLSGRTTQNKNVFFTLPADMDFASVSQSLIGKTLPVRITKAFPAILRGELVGTH
jgi:tRNA-2-methylthio-N6-dimethylallyladenosine synthase